MGTNDLDHLRKEAEKAIEDCYRLPFTNRSNRPYNDGSEAVANARAMLYLADVIRSGFAQMAEQLAGRR